MIPTFEYHLALLPHQRYLTLGFQFLRSMCSHPIWTDGRKRRRNEHGEMKPRTDRTSFTQLLTRPSPLRPDLCLLNLSCGRLPPSRPYCAHHRLYLSPRFLLTCPVHLPRQVRRISFLEFDTFRFFLTRALDRAMIVYPRFRPLCLSQRPRVRTSRS
jgi:hypothetical protein